MSEALVADTPVLMLSAEDRILRFAAAELVRYSVAAGDVPLTAVAVEPGIVQDVPPLQPGAAYRFNNDPLWIHGATARDVLIAVYRLLEQRGWRWYYPGPLGEVYRPGRPLLQTAAKRPVPTRVIVDRGGGTDDPTWRAETLRVIDWMAKRGLTTLALESSPPAAACELLIADLERRGLFLEVGGDLVGSLLAAARPETEGARRHRRGYARAGRLEAADAEGLAGLPAAARSALAAYPAARALRLTEPADAPLDLAATEDMPSPGERLRAVAEACLAGLAEDGELAVWQVLSKARRGYQTPSEARLVMPVERRSLASPLGAGQDPRNRTMLEEIGRLRDRPGGLEVVLPYADFTALRNLAGPLPHVIAADVRTLTEAGIEAIAVVVHGATSWWLYPVNLYVLAHCLEDPGIDVDALLVDWCDGLYGSLGPRMLEHLLAFEQAMRPLWALREVFDVERRGGEWHEQMAAATAAAGPTWADLEAPVTAMIDEADDPRVVARLEREAAICRLSRLHVEMAAIRVQTQLGRPTLALHATARDLVARAVEVLDRTPRAAAGLSFQRSYLDTLRQVAGWHARLATGNTGGSAGELAGELPDR